MDSELTLPDATANFERACQAMTRAYDSRGLRVLLYRGTSYTAQGLRDALREITSAPFSADRVEYISFGGAKDIDGELTFARHLQLLTNAYVTALEYERIASART